MTPRSSTDYYHTPCVRCAHTRGHHGRGGACHAPTTDQPHGTCPCQAYIYPANAAQAGTLVITEDQLDTGYAVKNGLPWAGNGGMTIETQPYRVVRRLEDGNFLAIDPALPA